MRAHTKQKKKKETALPLFFLKGGVCSSNTESGGNNIGQTAAAITHSGVITSTMHYASAASERERNTQVRKEARQQSAQQEDEERDRGERQNRAKGHSFNFQGRARALITWWVSSCFLSQLCGCKKVRVWEKKRGLCTCGPLSEREDSNHLLALIASEENNIAERAQGKGGRGDRVVERGDLRL